VDLPHLWFFLLQITMQLIAPIFIGWNYVEINNLFANNGCPMPFGEFSKLSFGFDYAYDLNVKVVGSGLFVYTSFFFEKKFKGRIRIN